MHIVLIALISSIINAPTFAQKVGVSYLDFKTNDYYTLEDYSHVNCSKINVQSKLYYPELWYRMIGASCYGATYTSLSKDIYKNVESVTVVYKMLNLINAMKIRIAIPGFAGLEENARELEELQTAIKEALINIFEYHGDCVTTDMRVADFVYNNFTTEFDIISGMRFGPLTKTNYETLQVSFPEDKTILSEIKEEIIDQVRDNDEGDYYDFFKPADTVVNEKNYDIKVSSFKFTPVKVTGSDRQLKNLLTNTFLEACSYMKSVFTNFTQEASQQKYSDFSGNAIFSYERYMAEYNNMKNKYEDAYYEFTESEWKDVEKYNKIKEEFSTSIRSGIERVQNSESIEKVILTTSFSSLTSLGMSTSLMGAEMGAGTHKAGLAIMAVGAIGQTAMQIASIFDKPDEVKDYNEEFWRNYKQFIDDPKSGVRECIKYEEKYIPINLGYRHEIQSNSTKLWMDNVESKLVLLDVPNAVPKSILILTCFTGSLKVDGLNIKSYSSEIGSNSAQQRVYEVYNLHGMLEQIPQLNFTCGSETTLVVTKETPQTKIVKNFIPGIYPGEPVDTYFARSDVCNKFPLKRVKFSIPSCSYEPLSYDFGSMSCSEMYSKSRYDEASKERYYISDMRYNNTNKVFIFKNPEPSFTFKPFTDNAHSFLCKMDNENTCRWPQPVLAYPSESVWIRKLKVNLALRKAFGFICPNPDMTLNGDSDFKSNLKVSKYGPNNQIFAVEFIQHTPKTFSIWCESVDGNTKSDIFVLKSEDTGATIVSGIKSKYSVEVDLTQNYGFAEPDVYGKPLRFQSKLELPKTVVRRLKHNMLTWYSVEFTFMSINKNNSKDFHILHSGVWKSRETRVATYNENYEGSFIVKMKPLDPINAMKECTIELDIYSMELYLSCPENTFKKNVINNHYFRIKYESSDEFCETGDQMLDCNGIGTTMNILNNKDAFHPGIDYINQDERSLKVTSYSFDRNMNYEHTVRYGSTRDSILYDVEHNLKLVGGFNSHTASFIEKDGPLWCCDKAYTRTRNRGISYSPKYKFSKNILIDSYLAQNDVVTKVDRNVSSELYDEFEYILESLKEIEDIKSGTAEVISKYKNLGINFKMTVDDVINDYISQQEYIEYKKEEIEDNAWQLFKKINAEILSTDGFGKRLFCCRFTMKDNDMRVTSFLGKTKGLSCQPLFRVFNKRYVKFNFDDTTTIVDTYNSEHLKVMNEMYTCVRKADFYIDNADKQKYLKIKTDVKYVTNSGDLFKNFYVENYNYNDYDKSEIIRDVVNIIDSDNKLEEDTPSINEYDEDIDTDDDEETEINIKFEFEDDIDSPIEPPIVKPEVNIAGIVFGAVSITILVSVATSSVCYYMLKRRFYTLLD